MIYQAWDILNNLIAICYGLVMKKNNIDKIPDENQFQIKVDAI